MIKSLADSLLLITRNTIVAKPYSALQRTAGPSETAVAVEVYNWEGVR